MFRASDVVCLALQSPSPHKGGLALWRPGAGMRWVDHLSTHSLQVQGDRMIRVLDSWYEVEYDPLGICRICLAQRQSPVQSAPSPPQDLPEAARRLLESLLPLPTQDTREPELVGTCAGQLLVRLHHPDRLVALGEDVELVFAADEDQRLSATCLIDEWLADGVRTGGWTRHGRTIATLHSRKFAEAGLTPIRLTADDLKLPEVAYDIRLHCRRSADGQRFVLHITNASQLLLSPHGNFGVQVVLHADTQAQLAAPLPSTLHPGESCSAEFTLPDPDCTQVKVGLRQRRGDGWLLEPRLLPLADD